MVKNHATLNLMQTWVTNSQRPLYKLLFLDCQTPAHCMKTCYGNPNCWRAAHSKEQDKELGVTTWASPHKKVA